MWANYRKWRHVLFIPLVTLAGIFMKGEPELSAKWYTGLGTAIFLGLAYLAEEIVWMIKRQGRPCCHCGQRIQMRSFRVQINCPHCGQSVE